MLDWILTLGSMIATSVVTWFFTRRKQNAEANRSEIENTELIIKIYREATEDLRKELKTMKDEINLIESKMEELTMENNTLKGKIAQLQIENTTLRQLIGKN